MNDNIDNFGNVIPAGWELDPVWGNINGAIRPIESLIGKGAPRPEPSSPLWNDRKEYQLMNQEMYNKGLDN